MKKIILAVLFAGLFSGFGLFAQVDAPVPTGAIQIIDNFESGNFWIWAGSDWDKYGEHKISSGANLSKIGVTEGKYSMELLTEQVKNKGDGAIWFYDGKQNLSGGKYIVADFYNPGTVSYDVAFALQTTNEWKWIQSETYTIPKGKHTVVFYVGEDNSTYDDVRRINITCHIYQLSKDDTSLYVDNIRLIK